jgi:hypothetical protein
VLNLCERIAAEKPVEQTAEMQLFHAAALKRAGDLKRAVGIWRELAENESREGYRSCLELAVFHEHKDGDISEALRYALRAESLCPYGRSERGRLAYRRSRLEVKVAGLSS